ncbi:ATP-dependent DNA helicase DinG [Aquibacillus albus]|uniref:3'-5' exonuclease DinG n=1 Tax=Aquibacillus albus TaxID=1168171 RepID=A0ABS2MVM9_9BACI|nr:ATP-dependent DNA helicase DinG [Aquibacillus albus]MBM7569853.1 ATP-dependent DNA helicase DinG [Aquibacillus albus]
MRKFVIVDLETTGHSPTKGDRIIEVGIVVIQDGKITTDYSTFINPGVEIPPFITNLTGIKQTDLSDAPSFDSVATDIVNLFKDGYVVAHNVPFDLGFLNDQLQEVGYKPLTQPVIDTVELSRILLPIAPGYKLGQLAEYLELQHKNPHRAISDAKVTSKLFSYLLDKLNKLPYETLFQLKQLEPLLKSDLNDIFDDLLEEKSFQSLDRDDIEIYRGIAIKKDKPATNNEQTISVSFGELVDGLYNESGMLAKAMEHYELRSGQKEMSETIFDAFQSRKHALIEAETGTGKSLAYLVPAIYESVSNKKRIVISTHLTQLQAQLFEKEIPLIKKLLPFDFTIELLKGKQHYLSLKRFEKELQSLGQDNYDITLTKAILLIWLTETVTGDVEEIQLPSSGKQFFHRLSAETEGGLDVKSPWFTRSFYQKARTKAQKANIVIVNHALMCADIVSDYQLLPSYQQVIIDEAHHLESTAAKHFGLRLDYVSVQSLLNHVGSLEEGEWLKRIAEKYPKAKQRLENSRWNFIWQESKTDTDELFRYLFAYVMDQQTKDVSVNDVGRYQYSWNQDKEMSTKWSAIKEMVSRLSFNLRDLIHFLSVTKEVVNTTELNEDNDELEEIQTVIDRMQMIIDYLEQLFYQNDDTLIKWIEIEAFGAKNSVYLFCEPIDISKILRTNLFDKKASVILTSATLTMRQSFSFIKERLGLQDANIMERKLQSPYSYDKQVQLMIPNDFPSIQYGNQSDFIQATCEAILSLAEITNGRMLVLFTSYDMLKKSYQLLREIMDEEFIIIGQGISSGSRERLKKNFQAFDRAILLGTSSFWEGVDIPGSNLSCLVIVRLPFQPPDHPIYQGKASQLKENGKNPFMELALPNAVIRFKQGFGRLIRSSTDRGIVFVCDERIVKARYGKYFTESIPDVPITYKSTQKLMQKVERWL